MATSQQTSQPSTSRLLKRGKSRRIKIVTDNLYINIKNDLSESDKVLLPEHVLKEIMRKYPSTQPQPLIFGISTLVATDDAIEGLFVCFFLGFFFCVIFEKKKKK